MSKDVGKYPQVVLRVSVDDKRLIKELGGSYSDIWRLGFDKFLEITPQKMKEKAEYHYKMWEKCNDIVTTKYSNLEALRQKYIEFGRSIDNPDAKDLSWIEAKTKKMIGVSVDGFLKYCREKSGDVK